MIEILFLLGITIPDLLLGITIPDPGTQGTLVLPSHVGLPGRREGGGTR